jgi:hypothetical protein
MQRRLWLNSVENVSSLETFKVSKCKALFELWHNLKFQHLDLDPSTGIGGGTRRYVANLN